MNRKFLDKRIVVSQYRGMTAPITAPDSAEGIIATQIRDMSDPQKKQTVDKAIDNVNANVGEFNDALSIFKANGKSEENFLDERRKFEGLSIAHPYFHKLVVTLWPKMLDKRFSFDKFLDLLGVVCNKYSGNINRITKIFEDLLTVLPTVDQKMGSPDKIVEIILDFLMSGQSPENFYNFVIQNMVTQWAYNMGKPVEVNPADAIKLQQTIRNLRNPVSPEEAALQKYYQQKANFDQLTYYVTFRTSEILLLMRQLDMNRIKTQFRNGVFLDSINYWINMLKLGNYRNFSIESTPFGESGGTQGQTSQPLGGSGRRGSHALKKYIFAQEIPGTPSYGPLDRLTPTQEYQYSQSGTSAAGGGPGSAQVPGYRTQPEDSSGDETQKFQELRSKKQAEMDSFANQLEALSRFIDDRIKNIFSKATAESPQIGPFQANTVFEYLLDTEKSLEEISQVKTKINQYIRKARDDYKSLRPTIENMPGSGITFNNFKKFALDWLDSKLIDFTRKLELKDLGLDFGKILLTEQNEFAQKQDTYENLKTEMESGRFIKPQIAPIALSVGFEMADILERISDKFKNLASGSLFQEQAMKTARKWQIFAKQQRNTVMKEIYPALADVIGIDATKPSVAPSFTLSPLSTSASSFNKNYRFAYELQSNKKVKDYWNSLFMESVNPVPMGDIIVEKPIHGNKSIGEEIKLHKKTMRRFKKKNRFKK